MHNLVIKSNQNQPALRNKQVEQRKGVLYTTGTVVNISLREIIIITEKGNSFSFVSCLCKDLTHYKAFAYICFLFGVLY